MQKGKNTILLLLITSVVCLVSTGCKERFEPDIPGINTGYLVVEGVINSSPGETRIKLTRSLSISSQNRTIIPELKAQVQVESENNAIFPLPEKGPGLYAAESLYLESSGKYRLRIRTGNGKEYLSEFIPIKKTPPIDSINWRRENNGLQLYVNAHNPQNDTRYYKWEYEETWEYVAPEFTNLKWENSMVTERTPDEQVYRCWGQGGSTSILLGSSAKLSQDIIFQQPLTFIPPASIKLSQKYSLLVRQYALTREAYEFLQMMKKNTESLGSFFDPQPSELKGNIHCLSNPDEPVIGFVSACNVIEKRIFIDRRELENWNIAPLECLYHNVAPHIDSLKFYFEGATPFPYPLFRDETGGLREQTRPCCIYIPLQFINREKGWRSTVDYCADCTKGGGKNVKPDFWP